MFELPRLARTRTVNAPLSSCALVSPGTVNVWIVSDSGSAVLTSSVPTPEPLTKARAPRVASDALVETFQSTLTVTPVRVALVGMVESKPKVPRLRLIVLFLPGAAVA